MLSASVRLTFGELARIELGSQNALAPNLNSFEPLLVVAFTTPPVERPNSAE